MQSNGLNIVEAFLTLYLHAFPVGVTEQFYYSYSCTVYGYTYINNQTVARILGRMRPTRYAARGLS